jgi:erythritol/L-threitol dehydrogenase
MKAAIYYGPGEFRIGELPMPKAGKSGVVVKVKYCGICPIIDLNMWQNLASMNVGKAVGHEWIGEVVEVGPEGAHLVKKGDSLYTFDPFVPCYHCAQCLQGDYWRCENWGQGMGKNQGAFAEYLWIPFITPRSHIKPPQGMDFQDAALIEPLHLSIGLAQKVKPGETVVIIGQHIVGLGLTAQLKKLDTSVKVITSAISKLHCDASEEAGADVVINGVEKDVVREVMKITKGRGADSVFICDARPLSVMQGIACARDAGKALLCGRSLMPMDPHTMAHWVGPDAATREKASVFDPGIVFFESAWGTLGPRIPMWQGALDLIRAGKICANKHVTQVFPLEEINEAFKVAMDFHESIEVQIEL